MLATSIQLVYANITIELSECSDAAIDAETETDDEYNIATNLSIVVLPVCNIRFHLTEQSNLYTAAEQSIATEPPERA
jgi:hypothetical protein